ncbi:MAG: hypothetical protein JWN70_1656 [Planctomycetaceae bacterium]|nr:hypothetical protein [Planctomycetaceae bacterium]
MAAGLIEEGDLLKFVNSMRNCRDHRTASLTYVNLRGRHSDAVRRVR